MNALPMLQALGAAPPATAAASAHRPTLDVFAQLLGGPPAAMASDLIAPAGAELTPATPEHETGIEPDSAASILLGAIAAPDPLAAAVFGALNLRMERTTPGEQVVSGKASTAPSAGLPANTAGPVQHPVGIVLPMHAVLPGIANTLGTQLPLSAAAQPLPAATDAALAVAASAAPAEINQMLRGRATPPAAAGKHQVPAAIHPAPLALQAIAPLALAGAPSPTEQSGPVAQDGLFALPATFAAVDSESAVERRPLPVTTSLLAANNATAAITRDSAAPTNAVSASSFAEAAPVLGSAAPAQLAQHGGSTVAVRADGALPPISVPFSSAQWGNEFASRVISMAQGQLSEAEIRVSPAELGPIEVKLRFDGDRVHAHFGAISAEAREALSANMHRLREMFASEGLGLGQTFVGHHGAGNGERPSRSAPSEANPFAVGMDEHAPVRGPRGDTTRSGLLDEFA